MASTSAFQLSRVYAAGWSAANKLTADEREAADPERVAALNPFPTDPQRTRWSEGFSAALGSAQRFTLSAHIPGH